MTNESEPSHSFLGWKAHVTYFVFVTLSLFMAWQAITLWLNDPEKWLLSLAVLLVSGSAAGLFIRWWLWGNDPITGIERASPEKQLIVSGYACFIFAIAGLLYIFDIISQPDKIIEMFLIGIGTVLSLILGISSLYLTKTIRLKMLSSTDSSK